MSGTDCATEAGRASRARPGAATSPGSDPARRAPGSCELPPGSALRESSGPSECGPADLEQVTASCKQVFVPVFLRSLHCFYLIWNYFVKPWGVPRCCEPFRRRWILRAATQDGAAGLCPNIRSSVQWFLGPSSRHTDLLLVVVLLVAIVSLGVSAWESS